MYGFQRGEDSTDYNEDFLKKFSEGDYFPALIERNSLQNILGTIHKNRALEGDNNCKEAFRELLKKKIMEKYCKDPSSVEDENCKNLVTDWAKNMSDEDLYWLSKDTDRSKFPEKIREKINAEEKRMEEREALRKVQILGGKIVFKKGWENLLKPDKKELAKICKSQDDLLACATVVGNWKFLPQDAQKRLQKIFDKAKKHGDAVTLDKVYATMDDESFIKSFNHEEVSNLPAGAKEKLGEYFRKKEDNRDFRFACELFGPKNLPEDVRKQYGEIIKNEKKSNGSNNRKKPIINEGSINRWRRENPNITTPKQSNQSPDDDSVPPPPPPLSPDDDDGVPPPLPPDDDDGVPPPEPV